MSPGRDDRILTDRTGFFRPCGAGRDWLSALPSDKSLGYFRSSRWDLFSDLDSILERAGFGQEPEVISKEASSPRPSPPEEERGHAAAPATSNVIQVALQSDPPAGKLAAEERQVPATSGSDGFHAGPLFDQFDLTLEPGHRTEAVGPFFYKQQRDTERIWAVPPLLSYTRDPGVELTEFDFLYPLLTYDRYGDQYRWQLFQLLSFSGGPTQTENARDRFTIFPIYFQQRSSDPNENYTAVLPFYGHLKHRLFRDEIFFVMLPFYIETRKRDVVTENYVYPFFHRRHGTGLQGWQFWPLVGREHKEVTTFTNRFDEVETVPGHDKFFVLWPFYFNETSGIGTDNPTHDLGVIPFYVIQRSPKRNSTTVLWPFFSHIDDQQKKYREWDAPWPLIEYARGEGKNTTRVFPFFSHARSPTLESDYYLWPVYKSERIHSAPLERRRTRICFFLYSDTREKNTETGATRRMNLSPLFSHRREFNGNTRLQIISPLEPFVAGSHKIERDYSPVWSVWRSERNAQTSATSQSLLWNLYRREAAPARKKVSLLFGLFQYQSTPEGKRMRLFYIPIGKAKPAKTAPGQNPEKKG